MSAPFFRVEMLPASHGDALLVEYGEQPDKTHRILIDAGPLSAFPHIEQRLRMIPAGETGIELAVVTHVDNDHIEGILKLLSMPKNDWLVEPSEIWFNGWKHLEEEDLGGYEGDLLSALIQKQAASAWNSSFAGSSVRADGAISSVKLGGGMVITLLSPTRKALRALQKDWQRSSKRWDLKPGDVEAALERVARSPKLEMQASLHLGPEDLDEELQALLRVGDKAKANGSSIAFLAEFAGRRCLFLGDAHMRVVCPSLRALGYSVEAPLRVSAVKLSHHGSKRNLTKEFLQLVDAEHYLVSTDGSVHGHPDRPVIQAILTGSRRPPVIWFNHRSQSTELWEHEAGPARTRFPALGTQGIVVPLTP